MEGHQDVWGLENMMCETLWELCLALEQKTNFSCLPNKWLLTERIKVDTVQKFTAKGKEQLDINSNKGIVAIVPVVSTQAICCGLLLWSFPGPQALPLLYCRYSTISCSPRLLAGTPANQHCMLICLLFSVDLKWTLDQTLCLAFSETID